MNSPSPPSSPLDPPLDPSAEQQGQQTQQSQSPLQPGPAGRPVGPGAYPAVNRTALARKVGVHFGHICKIMSGTAGVSVELAYKICAEIGVKIEDFLRELERVKQARIAALVATAKTARTTPRKHRKGFVHKSLERKRKSVRQSVRQKEEK